METGTRVALMVIAGILAVHAQPQAGPEPAPKGLCGVLESSGTDGLGSPAGTPCLFPFIYHNKIYDACVAGSSGAAAWCATSNWADSSTPKTWGMCVACGVSADNGDNSSRTTISDNEYYIVGGAVVGMAALATIIVGAVIKLRRPSQRRAPPNKKNMTVEDGKRDSDGTSRIYDMAQPRKSNATGAVDGDTSEHTYDFAKRSKTGDSEDTSTEYAFQTKPTEGDLYPLATTEEDPYPMAMPDGDSVIKSNDKQNEDELHHIDAEESNVVPIDEATDDANDTENVPQGLETVEEEEEGEEEEKGEEEEPLVDEASIGGVRERLEALHKSTIDDPNALKTLSPRSIAEVQAKTSAVRKVNEQARGANVGEKPQVDAASRAIKDQVDAQKHVSQIRRVNEQARGELVGQKTHFNANAQEMQRILAVQAQNSIIVNRQSKDEFIGKKNNFGADSVQISTASNAQKMGTALERSNMMKGGDLTGKPHNYSTNSAEMSRISQSQQLAKNSHLQRGVGEVTGNKPGFSLDSAEMSTYKLVQERNREQLVNKGVKVASHVPKFGKDSEEMNNYRRHQQVTSAVLREKAGMTGFISRDTVADARYHSPSASEYIEVSTTPLSPEAKQKFEAMMGKQPTTNTRPKSNAPSKKVFDVSSPDLEVKVVENDLTGAMEHTPENAGLQDATQMPESGASAQDTVEAVEAKPDENISETKSEPTTRSAEL